MMHQPLFGITAGTTDAVERAHEFGVQFVDLHFKDNLNALKPAVENCEDKNIGYVLNFEGAPVGWTPPPALKKELAARQGFLGFLFDEADHMQINAHWPVIDYYGYEDQHYLAETEGLDLFQARQAVLNALVQKGETCTTAGKAPAVEFLFPVMMHTAAKAGLNLSPKILKETCGPAMLATAMGAARQYNVDFWIDVDYWWHNETLGHSLERFQSALLLAYWSGASKIYVEGGAKYSHGHPLGTAIEKAYAEFIREYIPTHPRPYTWREFFPEIGIVRYDDTCFDIRQKYLGEYPGPLYGHVAAGPENTEWLNIWSLLSHGFIRTDSLSHQWESRRFNARTLFVPLHNVAVYDHEVTYESLAGLKLIFLSGALISPQTYTAVSHRVQEGATCVLPPRLSPPDAGLNTIQEIALQPDGKGQWLIVPEFYRLHYETFYGGPAVKSLRDILKPMVGSGDELVYNFGKHVVRFRQAGGDYPRHEIMTCYIPLTQAGSNPDQLQVEVSTL
jgi:hypothetical protein